MVAGAQQATVAPVAAVLDVATDLFCLIDAGGRVVFLNSSARSLLGISAVDSAHSVLASTVHPRDRGELRRLRRVVQAERVPVRARLRLRARDGGYHGIEVVALNLLEDPAVRAFVVAGRDVTGRADRQEGPANEDGLRQLVDNSPGILFSVDRDGVITSVVGRELARLGISRDGLEGRSVFDLGAEPIGDAVRRCLAGEDVDVTYSTGETALELRCRPVRDDSGIVVGVSGMGTDVTPQTRALAELSESENRWRALMAGSTDVAVIVDAEAVIQHLSPAGALFGWQPDDVIGRSAFDYVHPDDVATVRDSFDGVLGGAVAQRSIEFRLRRADGTYRWAEVTMRNRLDDPAVRGVVGNIQDVTTRRTTRAALDASQANYRLIVETTRDGILLLDDREIVMYANDRVAELCGIPRDQLVGSSINRWLDARAQPLVDAARQRRSAGQTGTYEIPFLRPDGQERYLLINSTRLPPPAPYPGLLVMISDITQRKRAEAELARLALHDALTGLPNRALLLDRIAGALTRRRRHGGVVALLLVDVDQFTSVNDSVGTAGGDHLLRQFTERLSRTVRGGDTVARLGGDEFAVLSEELEGEPDAALLADRLLSALAEPIVLAGVGGEVEAVVTASIGVAVTRADAVRPEDLLLRAELAMHRAKVRGRACHELLSDASEEQVVDRLRLVNELRAGLRRGELTLHYQPLVELRTGQVVGAEALARWHHPRRGLLHPAAFIGLAEESGLIRELGARVLRIACTDAAQAWAWLSSRTAPRPDDQHPTVAVNLSAHQLSDPGLSQLVAGVLAETGLPPACLMLEVTETALLSDTTAALHELQALRKLGVQIALDDFGTGFSSLTYLKHFPLNELKIDRSFVSELGIDQASDAIVASVVTLARAIGLAVVAEGVETEHQRAALVRLGCRFGQGHLFGHAVPADRFPVPTTAGDGSAG